MELSRDKIKEIINDDWLLMDDCEGNKNCDVVKELARIALASIEADPRGYIDAGTPDDGISILTKNKILKTDITLYTDPPAQMLEIENLEHFISFWKKVQAGQMKPGKNDIDHMVWFLEGLSNLTTPPAPVSVPDFTILDRLAGEMLTHAMNCERRVSVAYTHCAHRLAEEVRDLRDAMLQGGKS